jgi:hypothetical protein
LTIVELLQHLLRDTPTHRLRDIVAQLSCAPDTAIQLALAGQGTVNIPSAQALPKLRAELRRRRGMTPPQELRLCADSIPQPQPTGELNIASWVGTRTTLWHTVFSYSSPESAPLVPGPDEPQWPWFSQLDPDAQRVALLLVAEVEGDQQ